MKNIRSLCIFLSVFSPQVFANVLDEAWACAKGTANAGYELAGKVTKAGDVMAANPECIGYAIKRDEGFLAATAALIAINAVDSSLVSGKNCKASVKNNAARPFAKFLSSIMGGTIPQKYLADGSVAVSNELWNYLSVTPPYSLAVSRIDCACAFIEAGVSVENVVDIYKVVAKASAQCDSLAGNVPGYDIFKKGVKSTATAINNLGEDIFTGQVQHKDVEEFYLHDFGGWPLGVELQSHAAAAALNPSHNWRSTVGGRFYSPTWVKTGNGSANGDWVVSECKKYFDGHKMSPANADKVCSAMASRFESEYKSMAADFIRRNDLVVQWKGISKLKFNAVNEECKKTFKPAANSSSPENLTYNDCVSRMQGMLGVYDWIEPYDRVNSFNDPIDKSIIDGQLKEYTNKFFLKPRSMSGLARVAWDNAETFKSAAKGIEMALIAFDFQKQNLMVELNGIYKSRKEADLQQQKNLLLSKLGGADKACPSDPFFYKKCMEALEAAAVQCAMELDKVPMVGEFPDQAEFKKVKSECIKGYFALAEQHKKNYDQAININEKLKVHCVSKFKNICFKDIDEVVLAVVGGSPKLTEGYFSNKAFSQNPLPVSNGSALLSAFAKKWTATNLILNAVNTLHSSMILSCNATTPEPSCCQTKLQVHVESCNQNIVDQSSDYLVNSPILSTELGAAFEKLIQTSKKCDSQIRSVPQKMAEGKEAEVLMLSAYGDQCGRNERCKLALREEFSKCSGLPITNACARERIDVNKKIGVVGKQELTLVNIKKIDPTIVKDARRPEDILQSCKPQLNAFIEKFRASNTSSVSR